MLVLSVLIDMIDMYNTYLIISYTVENVNIFLTFLQKII